MDEVIDMKKAGMAMSATIGLNGQVDLEHSGKGQVSPSRGRRERVSSS